VNAKTIQFLQDTAAHLQPPTFSTDKASTDALDAATRVGLAGRRVPPRCPPAYVVGGLETCPACGAE